ncbi:MAG: FAD-dependent oxidoreductase, partial [Thermoplasmata archaeon]|nr:FAD-dependent oxidoreductase [Thermoplasmata archaeon]
MLDAVIIGAGPAGIASAIYLKRAGLDICILEKKRVGGLLHNAHLV